MPKSAIITGITGQDGYYLSRFLLAKGYHVHGWTRQQASAGAQRLLRLIEAEFGGEQNLELHEVDLLDPSAVQKLLEESQPDEFYNLASQSNVGISFSDPQATFAFNTNVVLTILEAIRSLSATHPIRMFQASSAAVFEGSQHSPQHEELKFLPRSPYGAAKASSQMLVSTYREAYSLFACSGILYNHESPLRPATFVTGKIVEAVAKIALGQGEKLVLGNLETGRDWGFAGDYVQAMWEMLQHEHADDFIIATGEWHSLREFLDIAFRTVGLSWEDYTGSDPKFFRPTEPVKLVGEINKIKTQLGWQPSTTFEEMIEMMVKEKIKDLRAAA